MGILSKRRVLYLVLLSICLCWNGAIPGGIAAGVEDTLSDEQSAAVLERLQVFLQSKARVGVIRLAGTLDDRGGDGKVRMQTTFEVATELQGPGKVRLEEGPLAVPAEGHDKPYQQFRTTVYNGEYWTRLVERQGYSDDVFTINRAEIFNERPYDYTPHRFGLNYLLSYAEYRLYDKTVGEILKKGIVNGKKLKLSEEASDAGRLLRIEIPDEFSTDTLWLIPEKGFAMYKFVHDYNKTEPAKRIVEEEIVDGLIPVAAGIWVPKSAIHRSTIGGKLQYEQKVKFSSAEFNLGATMEKIASVNLRPGCRVQDRRFGISFTIGEDPEIVIEKFKQSLGK